MSFRTRIKNVETMSGDKKLSLFFASLCVIDLFGVFPIVTLPRSLISCGYYGVPLMLLVFTLQTYTAVVLGRCWVIAEKLEPSIVRKNRYPYAAIADFTFGKYMKYFVTFLLDLTVFGSGIPNILVASQNLQLLGLRISNGSFDFSFCYFLLIIGLFLCPIMWLGSPKNMRALASISVCICTTVAILTWYCIYKADINEFVPKTSYTNSTTMEEITEDFDLSTPPLLNLLKAYGIISFQFDIHPMLLTIQADMENKKKIGKAVCSGILVTITFSVITTIFVYLKYGQSVSSNVLESLPRSWALYFVILLVTLQLCLTMAVGSSALFQHIEGAFHISRNFCFKRCLVRSIVVWFAVLIGEFIPKFDLIMGVVGGTLTGPLIFILPPLFYTKMLQLEKEYYKNLLEIERNQELAEEETNDTINLLLRTAHYGTMETIPEQENDHNFIIQSFLKISKLLHSECLLSVVVIIFGLCATFTSTYYNIFDIKSFNQFWSPCIQNISLSYKMI
ncbi:unnamed protein product [Diamesa serratosioi]